MTIGGDPFRNIEKKEKAPAKIELHFFRHSLKDGKSSTDDNLITLSQEGRTLAVSKAITDSNPDQSLAFGSPRIRTQETAGFVMTGSNEEITGDESLDELRAKIDTGRAMGSRIGVDSRLDYFDDSNTPVGKAADESYERNEYVKHTVENSDRIARENQDLSDAHYSHKASQIAQVIEKYVKVLPQWQKLLDDKEKKYHGALERYMGTHAGMCESFLAKVVEVTEGVDARNAFVDMIGHGGFDYIEGFEADVVQNESGTKNIDVRYKTHKGEMVKSISLEQLEQIVKEK